MLVIVLVFHEFTLLMVVKLVQLKNIAYKLFIADKLGVSVTADKFKLVHPLNTPR